MSDNAPFCRNDPVDCAVRREAGRLTDGTDIHGQRRESRMQDGSHRQDPMLFLVPIEGDGQSVEDLEREALEELRAVAEKHLSRLHGSGSPWARYLASVQANATDLRSEPPQPHVRLA